MSIALPLTLREIARFRLPALIWIGLTAVTAVAGPFGTLEAMGPAARALYWGGVIALSLVLNIAADALAADRPRSYSIAVWVGFVLLLSGITHALNSFLFAAWGGVADWVYLVGAVGLVTAAVHLVTRGMLPRRVPDAVDHDAFLRRLPFELRAPLVRIEAQDHYLNVVTAKGSTLILMRLGDAIAELSGQGLRVHRSHWIAPAAVGSLRREKGRDVLVMSDGAKIPVSRSYRSDVQEAGLI